MQTTVRASWATLLNVGVQCSMECAAINMAAWHARQPKKGTEIFFRITIFKHVPSYCEILVLSHHVLVDTSSTKQGREHCCHAIHPWKGVWQQSMRHQLMLDSTFVQSCFEREGTSVKVPRLRWDILCLYQDFALKQCSAGCTFEQQNKTPSAQDSRIRAANCGVWRGLQTDNLLQMRVCCSSQRAGETKKKRMKKERDRKVVSTLL